MKRNYDLYTIKLGLNSVLQPNIRTVVAPVIDQIVKQCSWILMEAIKLVELHVLKLLAAPNKWINEELKHTLSQTGIYQSSSLISKCTGKREEGLFDKNPTLVETWIQLYQPLHPNNLPLYSRDGMPSILQSLCKSYETNCANHVRFNFEKRARRYFTFIFDREVTLPDPIRKRLLGLIYRSFITGQTILKEAEWKWEHTKDLDITVEEAVGKEFPSNIIDDLQKFVYNERKLIPFLNGKIHFPSLEVVLETHWWKALPWLYRILRIYEKHNDNPENDQTAVFTLLPQRDIKPIFVEFNNTSVYELLRLCEWPHRLPPSMALWKKDDENQKKSWKSLLDLSRVHGWNHRNFHPMISTDGVSCCIHFRRNEKKEGDTNVKTKRSKKRKHVGPATYVPPTDLPKEQKLLVGLDPGQGNLFVTVRPTKYWRQKPYCVNWCTSWEYRKQIAMKDIFKKKAIGKMNEQEIQALQKQMLELPTAKTANLQKFQQHIHAYLLLAPQIWRLFGETRYHRREKWNGYMRRHRVLDRLCKRITHGNRNTVVGYGDASFSSTPRKYGPIPLKTFRTRLKQHCRVIPVDEFSTSKICCHCGAEFNDAQRRAHGVRTCKRCMISCDRDENGAINMIHKLQGLYMSWYCPPAVNKKGKKRII